MLVRDVGRLGRLRRHALGEEVVVQHRRIGGHRVLDVDDVRQDFVGDLDQVERLGGDLRRGRGHGGDGVAGVERLVARRGS